MTVAEYAILIGAPPSVAHKELVGMAALARRNARLLDPSLPEWMAEAGRRLIDYPPNVREYFKWADEETW